MGSIVLTTIWENITSFFKKEEELEHSPHAVPEAASEVFGHPTEHPKKIVEKSLPETARPKLPFTPDQLRKALKTEEPEQPVEEVQPEIEEHDISHEINAFESALMDVPEEKPKQRESAVAIPTKLERQPSFFDEFEQFILHEDLETEGLLETDILHKMREYHKRQREGKEFYIHSKDVKGAISRKLGELKDLEREWFVARSQIDDLESGITQIEHEIEAHSKDVKDLVAHAKSKSKLEHKVPAGHEFTLKDGRKLYSLLDLKIALRTMSDDIFRHHVTPEQNDFASWVRDTVRDREVADELEKFHDKQQADIYLSRVS